MNIFSLGDQLRHIKEIHIDDEYNEKSAVCNGDEYLNLKKKKDTIPKQIVAPIA